MPHDDDERSTVLQHRFDPTPAVDASFVLTVIEGPDVGQRFVVRSNDPRILLGHSPACVFRLSDREVSRRHVALEIVENSLRVEDLLSSNGTRIEGVSIESALLHGGEKMRVGKTTLQIDRGDASQTQKLPLDVTFGRFLGASREMRRLYPLFTRLATSNVPVVIEGETGTGKEALAETLHEEGPRASGPFVVFDCTAVLPTVMESELFGHERGAFTGAVAQRKGVFEQAHGGTLFVDEIGDLDVSLQSKLLRAVERGEIRRVGGDKWIKVDVRIIAATRRDLDREVQDGRFRDDLFHRLAVGRIELPPLRARRGDIAQLAKYFWKQLGGPSSGPDAASFTKWESMKWPGNVRELRNAVARRIALGDLGDFDHGGDAPVPSSPSRPSGTTTGNDGGDFIDRVVETRVPLVRGRAQVVDEYERRYIEKVLGDHGGNVVRAARASGVARRHFQRLRARQKKT
jgi:transcriptional regulator with GAF, ATPase, and Fis domain